jgi:hypothetical protein
MTSRRSDCTNLTLPDVYEITNSAAGTTEIPVLLRGKVPAPTVTENLGTRTTPRKQERMIRGAGYDD